jgi:hypothetical protein
VVLDLYAGLWQEERLDPEDRGWHHHPGACGGPRPREGCNRALGGGYRAPLGNRP